MAGLNHACLFRAQRATERLTFHPRPPCANVQARRSRECAEDLAFAGEWATETPQKFDRETRNAHPLCWSDILIAVLPATAVSASDLDILAGSLRRVLILQAIVFYLNTKFRPENSVLLCIVW